MVSTKCGKIEFGNKAYANPTQMVCETQGNVAKNTIKIIQKGKDGSISSGYRKVNFAEQRKQELYRKINKMLGGR